MPICRHVCDRLASKSLTLCYIAAVAGGHLAALSRLEGRLRRMFGEKWPFSDAKTKRNTLTDDGLNLLFVTFNH